MELAMFIWLASVTNGLQTLLVMLGTIGVCGGAFALLIAATENMPGVKRSARRGCILGGVALLVGTLLPSERAMWLMAGGYATQSAIQSETAKKVLAIVESKVDAAYREALGQKEIKP